MAQASTLPTLGRDGRAGIRPQEETSEEKPMRLPSLKSPLCLGPAAIACIPGPSFGAANELVGWAVLPAATLADGPTSGQFAFSKAARPANSPLYAGLQPVQGFSGVLKGAGGSLRMLVDNGFGSQCGSADALLRGYPVLPDVRTSSGGSGTVSAADWNSGATRAAFDAPMRSQRLLTGAELDTESVHMGRNGNLCCFLYPLEADGPASAT